MSASKEILNQQEMQSMINRLAFQIIEKSRSEDLAIIGVKRGGAVLGERLKKVIDEQLGKDVPIGSVDITLYRDDFTRIGDNPLLTGSEITFDVTDKQIVLVDDVIYTGRTTRAAIDAIMHYGRPSRIMLVALVDRGHRELPIQPDFIGKELPTSRDEIVHVNFSELDGVDTVGLGRSE